MNEEIVAAIIAGPYELVNMKNHDERVTVSLLENSQLIVRKFERHYLISTNAIQYQDLETALIGIEEKIAQYKNGSYTERENIIEVKTENLGKRARELSQDGDTDKKMPANKRTKTDGQMTKSDQKNDGQKIPMGIKEEEKK